MDYKYIGTITKVVDGNHYGWIGIKTVRKSDGSPHNLETQKDIFIHLGDGDTNNTLEKGIEVSFDVIPDSKREKACRVLYSEESVSSKLRRFATGGVEIALANFKGEQELDHPSAFASWCIDTSIVDQVKTTMENSEQVALLVIHWHVSGFPQGHYTSSEVRYVVNLSDPMLNCAFDKPGTHRVVALVIYGKSLASMRDEYLSRSNRNYSTDVIARNGVEVLEQIAVLGKGVSEVEIPANVFAQKPFDWKWIAGELSVSPVESSAGVDQCNIRRRRLFAYTLQPLWYLFKGLIFGVIFVANMVVMSALLLLGARGLRRHHLNPNTWKPWEIPGEVDSYVFIPTTKNGPLFATFVFSPFAILLMVGMAAIMVDVYMGTSVVVIKPFSRNYIWMLVYSFGIVFVLVTVVLSVSNLLMNAFDRVDTDLLKERVKERAEEREKELRAQEITNIVCEATGPRMVNVQSLPFNLRTIRFHAAALKQRVCRQYSA